MALKPIHGLCRLLQGGYEGDTFTSCQLLAMKIGLHASGLELNFKMRNCNGAFSMHNSPTTILGTRARWGTGAVSNLDCHTASELELL